MTETLGRSGTQSENLLAYEAGYRYQASRRLWFDLATYYNLYNQLRTQGSGTPFISNNAGTACLVKPLYFGNAMDGETSGADLGSNYKVNSYPGYLMDRVDLSLVGQNLQGSHMEFCSFPSPAKAIARSIFGRITWRH